MAYVTPKTNWASTDGVTPTDLNRIEANIADLKATNDVQVEHFQGARAGLHTLVTGTYTVNGNSYAGGDVAFGRTFAAAPIIQATMVASQSAAGCSVAPSSVTTSLASMWIYNNTAAVKYVLLYIYAFGKI